MKKPKQPQDQRPERKRPDKGHPEQDRNTRANSQTSPSAGIQQEESRQTSNKPITNQDEQRKTTNAGNTDEPMGELETEGERRSYRSKPCLSVTMEYGVAERTHPIM
jgi:hypothetical protein